MLRYSDIPIVHIPALDQCPGRQKNGGVNVASRFGQNLARCRRGAALSQEELGVRASLHRTAVGQLERGERVARVDTLVKLAGALSVSPSELLEGLEWTPGGTMLGQFRVRDAGDEAPEAGRGAQAGRGSPTRSA
jgi:transcriptional regulator with XRE-family HTH domain